MVCCSSCAGVLLPFPSTPFRRRTWNESPGRFRWSASAESARSNRSATSPSCNNCTCHPSSELLRPVGPWSIMGLIFLCDGHWIWRKWLCWSAAISTWRRGISTTRRRLSYRGMRSGGDIGVMSDVIRGGRRRRSCTYFTVNKFSVLVYFNGVSLFCLQSSLDCFSYFSGVESQFYFSIPRADL